MKKVSKIKIKSGLENAILEAVNEIGGFKNFIKRGDTVLLKPNFNTADPFPASTDINFLKNAIKLVYDYGAKLVIVGESSSIITTKKVMEKLGIFKLEKIMPPTKVIHFEKEKWVKKRVLSGKYLKSVFIPQILDRVDKLILLPCLKTHTEAQFTGSLKLSIGFVKPIQRVFFHLSHLQEKIAELNTIINPVLIIMDARKCFITKGPMKGELREPNLILASRDRVALDIEGIKIIQSFKGNSLEGVNPLKLSQIKRAIELGIDENKNH